MEGETPGEGGIDSDFCALVDSSGDVFGIGGRSGSEGDRVC